MRHPDARILVFARCPRAGAVKTRMQPVLGRADTLKAYVQLLDRTQRLLAQQRQAPVEWWMAPNRYSALPSNWPQCVQIPGSLGQRMQHAVARHLPGRSSVLLIGTDSPDLHERHLARALDALADGHDACLIPAQDGGYCLLGLRQRAPTLFHGIAWGTAQVAQQTRARLRALRWHWHEQAPLADLDEARDWQAWSRRSLSNDPGAESRA